MKIEIKKIKEKLSKILRKFWQNLFLVLLLLLLLDLILGGIFFWQYYLKPKGTEAPCFVKPLEISQSSIEKVSSGWLRREAIFEKAAEKQYPDPFNFPAQSIED